MSRNRLCDVFISYSKRSGEEGAKRLFKAIKRKGLQPFEYQYSLVAGHPWDEQVLKQLRCCRCVLVLVPPSKQRLTDWINHEIGIARAMGKLILPIPLGGDLRSSAPISDMLSRYWGWPLNQFLHRLSSFVSEVEIGAAAKLSTVWSQYIASGSARIVVGGIDPAKGDYFTPGVFRAITRLSCFFLQQFGANFLDELLIAQKTSHEEISRHDLVVIGGPNSLQGSPFEDYHKRLGIQQNDEKTAYLVGPQKDRVATNESDGIRKEGCVLGFAPNPMNLRKEMLLVSGLSGYGCQGAIEYLTAPGIDSGFVTAVERWRNDPRNSSLLFDLCTDFESASNTYVGGSGVVRQIL